MISIWWLIPAAMTGAVFGVLVAAIISAGKGDDDP